MVRLLAIYKRYIIINNNFRTRNEFKDLSNIYYFIAALLHADYRNSVKAATNVG